MPKFDDHPAMKWWREQSALSDRTVTAIPLNAASLVSFAWMQVPMMWALWRLIDPR